MAADLLLDGRLGARGVFRSAEVERLCREHRSGQAHHPHRIWQLLMLELWFREFIDPKPAAADWRRAAVEELPTAEAV
jgi:asparagine synthase (glutamine-hydrolysing)